MPPICVCISSNCKDKKIDVFDSLQISDAMCNYELGIGPIEIFKWKLFYCSMYRILCKISIIIIQKTSLLNTQP